MTESKDYEGGCRCRAIRYRVSGPPVMVEYCHCDSCRKSCGSVVSVLAGFQRPDFEISSGIPTYYSSSSKVKRSFCGTCGSPLFYEHSDYADEVYISLGSFDHPEDLSPDRHVWVSDRIPWYEIHDELPQHSQFSRTGSTDGRTPSTKSDEA